ncbi:MAG: DUF1573 domain-containing protein [Verrucomicrobia subdivision 3 bacterium]|nr:DUF1573 domain-containing protein [Limisphaerales bacterium]
MKNFGTTLFVGTPILLATLLSFAQPAHSSPNTLPGSPPAISESLDTPTLVWSDNAQERTVAAGEQKAEFVFWATNASSGPVLIMKLHNTCGCTVAKLPGMPWELAPGANVPIHVSLSLRGKEGTVTKRVTVETSDGRKQLLIKVHIPKGETLEETDQ